MPPFVLSGGVNESEPTSIQDTEMQDCTGAEYRVGRQGIFQARGRQLVGTIAGVTGVGLYEAGFDASAGYVIAHQGNSYHAAPIAASLNFSLIDNLPSGSSAIVGAHYASRHYTATGVANRRLELIAGGVTSFPIGMSASTFTVGVSVTQGVGNMTAVTGLVYWVTEYDSVRGIESTTGSSVSTTAFSSLASVVVTVTGISQNPRADTIRWYRSVDGGGFPDGGMIQSTAIGTTQITDTLSTTGSLNVPLYGLITVGGIDTERDTPPPVLSTIFGPFQDSLCGVSILEPRVMRYTPAGYPDSWPGAYGIPLQSSRQDQIVTGVVLPGRIGVFCNDAVYVVSSLPRDSASTFSAGEAGEPLTTARGCVSRRGACTFTPPRMDPQAAWVARDGIWASNLSQSPAPLTDKIEWASRVSVPNLNSSRLLDDPLNRRLIFLYRRATDTTYNTGVWYIDYQDFQQFGVRVTFEARITFADHGPLADAVTIGASDGLRRAVSLDSRSGNGQVYIEANQDADDSHLVNSSGAINFRVRTKEFLPAGPRGTVNLGKATWMHDAGPASITHRYFWNRRDSNPEVKPLPESTIRTASDVPLGRNVNSVSLELESMGNVSYGVHWIDIEGMETGPLGGRKGA